METWNGGLRLLEIGRALGLFALAAIAEIGGGWLVWQWLRVDRPWPFGLLGALVLLLYAVIHTWQHEAAFGRIYVAYGALFIVIALLWAYWLDDWQPDRWDLAGAALSLIGVMVIMFAPRGP